MNMLKKDLLLLLLLASLGAAGQEKDKPLATVTKTVAPSDSSKVNEEFFAALKEKTLGNYEQAESGFRNVLKTDPKNDAALYELASLNYAQNKEVEAESYARRAAEANPENKWYWILLSDIYRREVKPEQLLPVLDQLIILEPENQGYYFDKVNSLLLINKNKEAELTLQEIESRFGNSKELEASRRMLQQRLEDPEITIARLKKTIRKHPGDINNYLTLSEVYIKNGKGKEAQALLGKAEKIDPGNSFIHLLKSDAYQSAGKTEEAFEELKDAFKDKSLPVDVKIHIMLSFFGRLKEKGILEKTEQLAAITAEVHPSEAKAAAIYGDVLYQAQKLKEAKDAYKKALLLNKNVYLIWLQLLQIETYINDYEGAVSDGEEALNLFPVDPDLYFYTAIGYALKKNHGKAVEYFKNAISLNPKKQIPQSQILASLANSLNSLKRYKESDEAFEQSLKLEANNAFTLNNYAYYLSLRGEKLDKAAAMAKQANILQPDNASFEDTYAWVLFIQKKYAEARIWIEKAIGHNKNSAIQYEHYGDILFHLGEKEEALRQWITARDKGINSLTLEKKINEKKFYNQPGPNTPNTNDL